MSYSDPIIIASKSKFHVSPRLQELMTFFMVEVRVILHPLTFVSILLIASASKEMLEWYMLDTIRLFSVQQTWSSSSWDVCFKTLAMCAVFTCKGQLASPCHCVVIHKAGHTLLTSTRPHNSVHSIAGRPSMYLFSFCSFSFMFLL